MPTYRYFTRDDKAIDPVYQETVERQAHMDSVIEREVAHRVRNHLSLDATQVARAVRNTIGRDPRDYKAPEQPFTVPGDPNSDQPDAREQTARYMASLHPSLPRNRQILEELNARQERRGVRKAERDALERAAQADADRNKVVDGCARRWRAPGDNGTHHTIAQVQAANARARADKRAAGLR